jgi:hypothetical protein
MPGSLSDPLTPFRLDGRLAVVTGASSGLGDRFVRVLAGAGATVVAAARRADRLEALASEVEGVIPVACDVGDDEACRALVERAEAEGGGTVDVLVNNAGVSDGPANAEVQDPDDFRRVLEVNLEACFVLARLCAPAMLAAGRGSIVNISSIHGLVASSPNRQAGYVASKFGVVGLTQELGCQWAAQGVRVNAIAPGYFASELSSPMLDDESGLRWVVRNTPMRRAGDPHELDGALLFLAGDASTYVTGQTLAVDGGWTAR